MALVSLRTLLEAADRGNYAVGAFNVNNMEAVQAVVTAAEAERSPAIIQVSQGAIKYAGIETISTLVRMAAEKASVPIALHLDHGTDYDTIIACIRNGFTSVMFDGSQYEMDENIARTKEIVKIAHAVGVSVEGEIGKIGGVEEHVVVDMADAALTPVEDAIKFFEETGVDALAMSFGTAHGHYTAEPKLDLDRVKAVHDQAGAFIVMHGGSGVPISDVQKGIKVGIRKINIDTELREAFVGEMRNQLEAKPKEIDPRKILGPATKAMAEKVAEKMRQFGSSGQA